MQWYVATGPEASLAQELSGITGAGLLGVLRTLHHDRIRHCASTVCDGMFVDTSTAGRRRYCMPDLCGNRLNVAKHRARQLAASGPDKTADVRGTGQGAAGRRALAKPAGSPDPGDLPD